MRTCTLVLWPVIALAVLRAQRIPPSYQCAGTAPPPFLRRSGGRVRTKMAAPLVPLSQQVWCWGAPRGGADGGCRGKDKTSRKRGSRAPRRRALKARKAEWRGPGGSEGDRPARPAYSCARQPPEPLRVSAPSGAWPGWGGGLFCEPRRASPIGGERRRWARRQSLSPAGSGVVPEWSRKGIRGTPASLRTPGSPSPGSRFRCACEKRGSYSSNGGHQSTSSESPDAFRERIKCHRDVQKTVRRPLCLLPKQSFILQPLSNVLGVRRLGARQSLPDKVSGLLQVTPIRIRKCS